MYKHTKDCQEQIEKHCDCGATKMNQIEHDRSGDKIPVKNPLIEMQQYLKNDLKLKPPYIDSIMLKLSEVFE